MAVFDGHAVAMSADDEAGFDEARAIPFAEQLLRLGFHFFLFAADERHDVAEDVERGNTGITGAGSSLHGNDEKLFQAEGIGERFENEDESGGGAIRICDDEAGTIAAIFLLQWNGIEVSCVDFRNEKRDVRVHSMIFGVAHDGIARAGEIFFATTGDGRIERGENEVAIEIRFKALDDEVGGSGGKRFVEVPLRGFGIFFSRGAFRGGDFRELEPGMIGEELDEALADNAGGAEDSGTEFLLWLERRRTHAAPRGLEL